MEHYNVKISKAMFDAVDELSQKMGISRAAALSRALAISLSIYDHFEEDSIKVRDSEKEITLTGLYKRT